MADVSMTRFSTTLFALFLLAAPSAASVSTSPAPAAPVAVTLVPESGTFQPGQPLRVLFRFEIQPGWHTYWRNPGETGRPVSVIWDLPPGWKNSGLAFPLPVRLERSGRVVFGYEGTMNLVSTLIPSGETPSKPATLRVSVAWVSGRGREEASGERAFRLDVRPGPPPVSPPEGIREAMAFMPSLARPATIRDILAGGWSLEFPADWLGGFSGGRLEFYPENREGVLFSKPILGRVKDRSVVFPMRLDLKRLRGAQVEGLVGTGSGGPILRVFATVPPAMGEWFWRGLAFLLLGLSILLTVLSWRK